MSQGFFITGTDTGVGKTVVSAILCARLGASYWKPVQTGTRDGTDSDFARQWLPASKVLKEAYSFSEPLSPHAAATAEGIEISLNTIMTSFSKCPLPVVVEGAGGALVPLNDKLYMADLIKALALPAIVVSRSGLGTINHTLLTLQALRAAGVSVAGVVMVGEHNAGNRNAIEKFGRVPVIGEILPCREFTKSWMQEAAAGIHFGTWERERQDARIH